VSLLDHSQSAREFSVDLARRPAQRRLVWASFATPHAVFEPRLTRSARAAFFLRSVCFTSPDVVDSTRYRRLLIKSTHPQPRDLKPAGSHSSSAASSPRIPQLSPRCQIRLIPPLHPPLIEDGRTQGADPLLPVRRHIDPPIVRAVERREVDPLCRCSSCHVVCVLVSSSPEFDPALLPKGKKPKNNQQQVRLMLPMSVQCKACGEYVHKGKKFNGRKEEVVGETYLGIRIYRLYFRCTTCLNEITFKTDPEHSDYTVERGASRNFEPWKQSTKEELLQKQKKEREEVGDAMKALENRTQQSKNDMAIQDAIEEVRERNARAQAFTTDDLLGIHVHSKEDLEEEQIEEMARKAFERKNQTLAGAGGETVKRLPDPMDLEDDTITSGASSLPVLKRLPDPVDFTKDDAATEAERRRRFGARGPVDLLAGVEVSDSEGEEEEQKNGASAASGAAASTPPAPSAAPSAPSLPSGLVLLPKKRKHDHNDEDATSGGGGEREKRKKEKKDKKAKKALDQSSAATSLSAEAMQSDAVHGQLNSLLGNYDSD
jgi:hypothetical protein